MRIILLLALFSNSALLAQSNRASEARWHEYAYPASGFAMSAPTTPNIHPDFQTPDVTVYSWQLTQTVRASVHAGVRPGCLQVVAHAKEGPPNSDSKDPQSTKEITIAGNPGLESVGQNRIGREYRERVYCVAEKAYALTAEWPLGQPEPPAVSRWLSSFRLLSK